MEDIVVEPKDEPTQELAIQINPDAPPMVQIAQMMQAGVKIDVDQMAKLQEISERYEANEARKAFHVAMAAFKADPPEIFKNKTVTYTKNDSVVTYDHSSLDSLAAILDESFAKCDLSFTWKTEDMDKGVIKVTCILTHKLGHSESASMTSLADATGSKNPIQAKGSAITYLQRYTLRAVAGVAEKGQDDDGAGAGDNTVFIEPPNDAQWECIDLIIGKLPKNEGIVDRRKLAKWFLATNGSYPSTKIKVDEAAEYVVQKSPKNIYKQ